MTSTYTALVGDEVIAAGQLVDVLPVLKERFDQNPGDLLLVFEDETGKQFDFDLRGPLKYVLERSLPAPKRTGPGRPKLGVVAREISLLPRHWEWLEEQPNGASAAIRRLIDEARKSGADRERRAREAAARVMTALAGDRVNYEEALRALYAGDATKLRELSTPWPRDVSAYILSVAGFQTAAADTYSIV